MSLPEFPALSSGVWLVFSWKGTWRNSMPTPSHPHTNAKGWQTGWDILGSLASHAHAHAARNPFLSVILCRHVSGWLILCQSASHTASYSHSMRTLWIVCDSRLPHCLTIYLPWICHAKQQSHGLKLNGESWNRTTWQSHLHSHALIVHFNPWHPLSNSTLVRNVRSQWHWYRYDMLWLSSFVKLCQALSSFVKRHSFRSSFLDQVPDVQTQKTCNSVQPYSSYSNRGFHIVPPRWTALVVMNRMRNIHSNIDRKSAERCRKWHRKHRNRPRYTW